ncbi:MAG: MOMP family protein [Simkaniaceae bacterium]|nr:MOMP family protein [Simkaniaceae bacterium]
MKSVLHRIFPILGILCSHLYADSNAPKEITPATPPVVTNGINFILSADFIYFTARQDGLSYALSGFGTGTSNASKGSVHRAGTKWDPGFKIGLGLNLAHDGWDIFAEYTRLQTHDSSHAGNTCNSRLYPFWNIGNRYPRPKYGKPCDLISSAASQWDLSFNMFDLELARNYYISTNLALRPHVGLKGGWINQDYQVNYHSNSTPTQNLSWKMQNNQDYSGIGLRAGLDTCWYLNSNFCIYGDFALTGMSSHYTVHRKDTAEALSCDCNNSITWINTKSHIYTVKPVLELGLGLRFETWFNNNCYHFSIQAGWEEQVWINHNQLIHLYNESNHGDLSLQGLTIKTRFAF